MTILDRKQNHILLETASRLHASSGGEMDDLTVGQAGSTSTAEKILITKLSSM